MVTHVYSLGIWDPAETAESRFQVQPGLHSEFEASLSYNKIWATMTVYGHIHNS